MQISTRPSSGMRMQRPSVPARPAAVAGGPAQTRSSRHSRSLRRPMVAAVLAIVLAMTTSCSAPRSDSGSDEEPIPPTTSAPSPSVVESTLAAVDPVEALAAGCANVIAVDVERTGATYRFDVTVRSADTGPEKYADAWEVRTTGGLVLGVRELLHDHVGEQPFTRSLTGVAVPEGVDQVVVAARDSEVGFCGQVLTVAVAGG